MIIPLEKIISDYGMKIQGVIHIGGHRGQEIEKYKEVGIQNGIFFEPQKLPFMECYVKSKQAGYETYNLALGNKSCRIDMNTAVPQLGMSSSILSPAKHLEQYPDINFEGTEEVEMTTLDSFLTEGNINLDDYNFINIDVQGYELEVFKGAKKTLERIDYVYSEVNRDEVYENCAMVEDLDLFLSDYNLVRVLTDWGGETWGDALYVKNKK